MTSVSFCILIAQLYLIFSLTLYNVFDVSELHDFFSKKRPIYQEMLDAFSVQTIFQLQIPLRLTYLRVLGNTDAE